MGYRSEVALVTTQNGYSRLMAAVACNPEATRLVVEGIESENYVAVCRANKRRQGNVLFYWDWIKWYADSDQIRLIEDWMNVEEYDKDYDDVEFQFVRIGESDDDAEQRGNAVYGLGLHRSISK